MSSLAWNDFDEAERQRAERIMAFFQEKESRDELGLGAMGDSIGDNSFRVPAASRHGEGARCYPVGLGRARRSGRSAQPHAGDRWRRASGAAPLALIGCRSVGIRPKPNWGYAARSIGLPSIPQSRCSLAKTWRRLRDSSSTPLSPGPILWVSRPPFRHRMLMHRGRQNVRRPYERSPERPAGREPRRAQ